MENYIELSYSDITNIMLKTYPFNVEQSGANVILRYVTKYFETEFTLYGVVSESESVYVDSIEGDEECPALRCTVGYEGGRCESMYPERVGGRLRFFNYGSFEEKSATTRDILEHGISGVYEKNFYLGESFLNDAEKKLAAEIDYIALVLYPESARRFSKEELLKIRSFIKDGTAFATALDSFIGEDMGLPGRRNLRKLVKEAKRHCEKEFDRDKYAALCKEAVKDLPFYAEKEALEKYGEVKDRISGIMKNAGYLGEYPCFEKGEKYINFDADVFGNELGFLCARFGIKGEKAKKYVNKATGDDRLLMFHADFEDDAQLSAYTDGIFAVLEGKRPSKEFEEIVLGGNIKSASGRSFGVLCIILALCLAAVIIACGMKNVVPGFGASLLLLGFGLYMSFSKGKVHVLKADKGDRI
ncbi:MAG: hypothetical protein E7660_05695 [Ruminococcaceae bacterium]|nr:hypothetical protein [Oscillospiraceae bacterium]